VSETLYTYCPRPRCLVRNGYTVMRGSDARLARLFDGCGGGLINMLACPVCGREVHPTTKPPPRGLRIRAWIGRARRVLKRLRR